MLGQCGPTDRGLEALSESQQAWQGPMGNLEVEIEGVKAVLRLSSQSKGSKVSAYLLGRLGLWVSDPLLLIFIGLLVRVIWSGPSKAAC